MRDLNRPGQNGRSSIIHRHVYKLLFGLIFFLLEKAIHVVASEGSSLNR